MNVVQLKDLILEKLNEHTLDYNEKFDRKQETLRIERKDNREGVNIELNKLLNKVTKDKKFLDEVVYYITETLKRMGEEESSREITKHVFPVVRSTSFPKEMKTGTKFIIEAHTAETNIYYAFDFGTGYELLGEDSLEKYELTEETLKFHAFKNLSHLPIEMKMETVQENDFYFISHKDGYDASRILNKGFLDDMHKKILGEMMIGLPHQDVLIIADVKNEVGYDILAQMMMQYFAEGLTPITSLSFSYRDKKLEPVFILGKARDYNKYKGGK
ncbi:DUF1444 family protein [Phocicoccus pinnipedialis]|uniref:DUF1444 domain-containing protein n=1 Tax=Phocicoccus pinnipedialis TaxID=110845 RepID=A0A6V7RBZ9_9BACL|nr:DUF1444 family protein [Jeotgalicoccus pinnipedialis]MBP1939547.1 uncharacterized protein YtpQ (UPF0354 family) [Jeotgalicoccus pinnipedialis]CAD2074977.1 hypothetical protein JEOPIN946_00892 [Jeotgalicoccus pinnipedialis]